MSACVPPPLRPAREDGARLDAYLEMAQQAQATPGMPLAVMDSPLRRNLLRKRKRRELMDAVSADKV